MDASLGSRWYAVQARPKQEQRAAMNLTSSGLTTFLPMIRQAGAQAAPLFPRYLFVRCDMTRSANHVRYARGVAKVLGTSDGPSPVDDAIILSIQDQVGEDGCVKLAPSLKGGDPVEITAGPLCGLQAIFRSATSVAERVVLLLATVNNQMRVVVDSTIVKRIGN